jgi:hypothetical protein
VQYSEEYSPAQRCVEQCSAAEKEEELYST